MAEGDLITAPYQVELRGLLFGAGTAFEFEEGHDGFGLPDLRTSDTARPQAHGVFAGPDYMAERPLVFKLNAVADTAEEVEALLAELGAAFAPVTSLETDVLVFTLAAGVKYRLYGRPRRMATNLARLKSGVAGVTLQFVATDPRIYANELETDSTSGGETTGGLGFPHGFPHGFGSASPGAVELTNDGNIPAPFRFTVTADVGGITSFEVTKGETGETFGMLIELVEDDVITVDTKERTVVLNGTASRIGNVVRPTSTWLELDPGVTTLAFTSTGSGTATFATEHADAYVF